MKMTKPFSKIRGLSRIAQAILMHYMPRIPLRKRTKPLSILFMVPTYHTNMLSMTQSLKQAGHSVAVIVAKTENFQNYKFYKPLTLAAIKNDPSKVDVLPFEVADIILVRDQDPNMLEIAHSLAGPATKMYNYNQKPLRRQRGVSRLIKDLKRLRTLQLKGVPLQGICPVDHHYSIENRWPKKLLTRSFNFPVFDYPDHPVLNISNNHRLQVLMVGKLAQPRKRHFWLIKALQSSGIPCDLQICGAGLDLEYDDGTRSHEHYKDLKKCAVESSEGSKLRITLNEDVNFFELSAFYQNAQIFVLPSIQEEFGISVLEAMTHSCAVIVSDEVGAARHITHEFDGLVFPTHNFNVFEQSVHRLLNDQALQISLQTEAKKTIDQNHGYAQFAQFIESLA